MNTPKIHDLVSTIILARHGKAVAADGKPDAERELNDLGVRQANALGFAIGNLGVTVVLSSPLKRAVETMRIATNGSSLPIRPVAELSCLDDPNDPLMVMWDQFGNVPIRQYFGHPLAEHLKTWGRTALSAVIREIQNSGPDQKVLIGGHALLQNALLWAIAEKCKEDGDTFGGGLVGFANNILEEGQAFVVNFERRGCEDAHHLKPVVV